MLVTEETMMALSNENITGALKTRIQTAFEEDIMTESEIIVTRKRIADPIENASTETRIAVILTSMLAIAPAIAGRDRVVGTTPIMATMIFVVILRGIMSTRALVTMILLEGDPSIAAIVTGTVPRVTQQTKMIRINTERKDPNQRVEKNQSNGHRAFKRRSPPLPSMPVRRCFTNHCRTSFTIPRASCIMETRNARIIATTRQRIHPLSRCRN
mmetsp:Transcript_10723/g.25792  ORF Transcript_10723/g.25792 Transcript_10723/m.25792 type:complete len:214 (+) Transcript_10723:757-1398(+)